MPEKKEKIENEEKSTNKKEQIKKENKLLGVILICIFGVLILVIAGYFYVQAQINLDYEGVKFKAIQQGKLLFYQTSIPYEQNGEVLPFNLYLRNKPSDLGKISFENKENYELMKLNVIDYQISPDCDGDATIGIANLVQVNQAFKAKFFKDENATCDPTGDKYNHFTLRAGDKTEIKEIGPKCYELVLKEDCDILPLTERLMLEMLVKYNQLE